MLRFGQIIGLKEKNLDIYKKYHEDIWPEIASMINQCNIRNYSIYHLKGFLFAYMEYDGNDFEGDMAKMAADPKTLEWWDIMKPMQEPVKGRKVGEWWANMEEVFHQE